MFNTYCWMYGHLNLPHEYMVLFHSDDNNDVHDDHSDDHGLVMLNTYYWVYMYGHLNLPHEYMVLFHENYNNVDLHLT